ncbi:DUF3892 domain-containing protein [Mucilaginibacter gotjawali]|uniref:Uncharacterized protein n=2 Tax=Mucilaginibacter gotjawali TaxID=1550579 RepID=A0A839SIM6_9SPHI|nr:DUF3892 domain-containing protein [Mucilaginibacter gotjawali]MBB3056367.1 hypothetical protein [Mucilaginibacter gotjawali]BAU55073.1 hypothetical protein MgSA37_03254 [Mucilaginibacter gotjawali]
MAVRITSIKKEKGPHENPYLAIRFFAWENEQINVPGITDRAGIYDWIKDNRGEAYIKDKNGVKRYLLAAVSPLGNKYVKTVADESEPDQLLELPESA